MTPCIFQGTIVLTNYPGVKMSTKRRQVSFDITDFEFQSLERTAQLTGLPRAAIVKKLINTLLPVVFDYVSEISKDPLFSEFTEEQQEKLTQYVAYAVIEEFLPTAKSIFSGSDWLSLTKRQLIRLSETM